MILSVSVVCPFSENPSLQAAALRHGIEEVPSPRKIPDGRHWQNIVLFPQGRATTCHKSATTLVRVLCQKAADSVETGWMPRSCSERSDHVGSEISPRGSPDTSPAYQTDTVRHCCLHADDVGNLCRARISGHGLHLAIEHAALSPVQEGGNASGG